MNIDSSNLNNYIFFDIETCGQYYTYDDFKLNDNEGAHIYDMKCQRMKGTQGWTGDPIFDYKNKVSIHPEFGKIVCLSFGKFVDNDPKIKTIMEDDDLTTMILIGNLFKKASSQNLIPIGWNIKEFDVPWINRRTFLNGLKVPNVLDTNEKKPWDVNVVDIKEYWKGTSKLDITFEEAAYALKLPSPKAKMNGSMVHDDYWNGNLDNIKEYCEMDVITMMLMLKKLTELK